MNKIVNVPVGTVVVDSLPFSQGQGQASALWFAGARALAGYLGAISAARVQQLMDSHMGFMPVTLGGEYEDGPADEIGQLKAIKYMQGGTVWLDMEGLKAWKADPKLLIAKLEAWSAAINAEGWLAGLYAGVPQPLTSQELYKLRGFTRYWKGQGRQVDRTGALAEPSGCGWCMTQMFPAFTMGGVLVDANMVGSDYKGRVPTMMVAA